jgi:hypothetical protein
MNRKLLRKGDLVLTPATDGSMGNHRVAKIITLPHSHPSVMAKYIDYPKGPHGWFTEGPPILLEPIKHIVIPNE